MSRIGALRGLYAISDNKLCAHRGLEADVLAALQGGAVMIQYRDKGSDSTRREREAKALLLLCRRHHARLIINDDVELTQVVGADGVHLGAEDAPLRATRTRLGDQAIIGVSCYDSLELAYKAKRAGADYVAFGSFAESPTKPDATRVSLALLREASDNLQLPIVAIGGVTPENGAELIAAGASLLAVISGIFGTTDPEAAARRYCALFKGTE